MLQVFKFTILFSPHDHFMVSYYYSHFTDKETKARETELSKITWASKWQNQDSNFIWQNPGTVLFNTVLHRLTHRPWMSMLTSSLTMWSWGHYLTSVNLSFFICNMEGTFFDSSRCWENRMGKHMYTTTSTMVIQGRCLTNIFLHFHFLFCTKWLEHQPRDLLHVMQWRCALLSVYSVIHLERSFLFIPSASCISWPISELLNQVNELCPSFFF